MSESFWLSDERSGRLAPLLPSDARGVPSPEDEFQERKVSKAAAIGMKTLMDRGLDRLLHVYDVGDRWWYDVVIEQVFEGDAVIA